MLTAMDYVDSLLDLIGNTPLLRFHVTWTCPSTAPSRGRSCSPRWSTSTPAAR